MATRATPPRPLPVLSLRACVALPALAAALISGSGCYYLHVGVGQAKVLLGREPIADALHSSALDSDEKAKLALVPKIRAFAQDHMGLVRNDSYTKFYDTGRRPVSWNVAACRKTSFTPYLWSFPFVGDAPYKGFFDIDEARAEAGELAAAGYDVAVREVGAYSTLGWFDDPVFRGMLGEDVGGLAETIIHELTHATVFKKGDASFNESVATFVGERGALEFLAAEFGPGSREVRAMVDERADELLFTAFIDDIYGRLDRIYRSGSSEHEKLARREAAFREAKAEFETLRRTRMRDPASYSGFAKRALDNAVILGYRGYHADLRVYAEVLALCGGSWPKALGVFRAGAESDQPHRFLVDWCARDRNSRGSGNGS